MPRRQRNRLDSPGHRRLLRALLQGRLLDPAPPADEDDSPGRKRHRLPRLAVQSRPRAIHDTMWHRLGAREATSPATSPTVHEWRRRRCSSSRVSSELCRRLARLARLARRAPLLALGFLLAGPLRPRRRVRARRGGRCRARAQGRRARLRSARGRRRRAGPGAPLALGPQRRRTPPGRAPVTAPSRTTAFPATQTPSTPGGLCLGSS